VKSGKKKDIGELRLKADEFDEMMRHALGASPKHLVKNTSKPVSQKKASLPQKHKSR
jgi:hypothetical protein